MIQRGDFNAHVRDLSDVGDAHVGLHDCSEFFGERRCVCSGMRSAGKLVVDLEAATSLAIATGQVARDEGQFSFPG